MTLIGLIRNYLEELARELAVPAGKRRREREALERSFTHFQFRLGKKTWRWGRLACLALTSSAGPVSPHNR
jgi:hypothetical protein